MENNFDNAELIQNEFNKLELFHYTTFEALEKIIETKSLKFNRHDKLNDLIESRRTNVTGQNYYVSCFTYDSNESIPLWHIYSKKEEGVRINIKNRNFFSESIYYNDENDKKRYFKEKVSWSSVRNGKSVINYRKVVDTPKGLIQFGNICKGKVIYDNDMLKDKFVKTERQECCRLDFIYVYKMALLKSTAWKYEKEARFFTSLLGVKNDIGSLFVGLTDDFFNNMTITINPFVDDYDYQRKKEYILELMNGYNVNIRKSSLHNCIRL